MSMEVKKAGNSNQIAKAADKKIRISVLARHYGTLFGLLLICAVFTALTPTFASGKNIFTIIRQNTSLAILSLGLTFVMITGRSDLSIGYTTSFMGVIVAALMSNFGFPIWISIILVIIAGALVGLINGFAVAYVGIPDFIATLGIGYLVAGLNQWYTKGYSISGLPAAFDFFGLSKIGIVPVAVIILAIVFAIFSVIINKTRFGRHLYAIGDNEEATMMSGVNTKFNVMMAFAVCGVSAALAAIVLTSKLGNANPLAGESYLLQAIASVYLGSTAFKDGEPNLLGTIVGTLIIGVMTNGLTLLNVAYYFQDIATGIIIIIAVTLCIFRLHPATCTEKSCHSAGKNLPRYRISLPVITNIGKM